MEIGAYEFGPSPLAIPDPVWPDLGFDDLMKIAFKKRIIKDTRRRQKRLTGK